MSQTEEPKCAVDCPVVKDLKDQIAELKMVLGSITQTLPPEPETQQPEITRKVIKVHNAKFIG
ncbi:MAG: hypothetical protein RR091_12450 [Cloacibacillus sp.]